VRIPRRGLLALAAMTGVAVMLLTPTAASAAYYGSETDYGVEVPYPPDTDWYRKCTDMGPVLACFQPYGDYFYVHDDKADGDSAAVDWFDADSNRWGSCVNKHGAGTWAACDKDFTEGHEIYFRAARYTGGNPVDSGNWVSNLA
jgi:hypothetical protein